MLTISKKPSKKPSKDTPKTAKIFMNGRSQAVRLPAQFRFDTDEVYIRKDETTGDVILSKRPNDWSEFFELQAKLTDDDLADLDDMMNMLQAERDKARELAKQSPKTDIFADWEE